MPDPSVAELAYAAGIIDGEGCIHISKTQHVRDKRLTMNLHVPVSMPDKCVIAWLGEMFGGDVSMASRDKLGHSNAWIWRATDRAAERVLLQVLPYLRAKKTQAEVGLQFRKLIGAPGIKTPPANVRQRIQFYWQLREMKRQGKSGWAPLLREEMALA